MTISPESMARFNESMRKSHEFLLRLEIEQSRKAWKAISDAINREQADKHGYENVDEWIAERDRRRKPWNRFKAWFGFKPVERPAIVRPPVVWRGNSIKFRRPVTPTTAQHEEGGA